MSSFNLKSKWSLFFGIAVAAVVAGRCIWIWQPERQVKRHHEALLESVGDRDWKKLNQLFDDGFKHPSGFDKALILKEAGEVRRHFFSLTVLDRGFPSIELSPTADSATVKSVIRLEGTGTPIASYAISAVNEQEEPFIFSWQRKSWKPWDWKLMMADHPLIHANHSGSW